MADTMAARQNPGQVTPGNTITPQGSGLSDPYSSDDTLTNLKKQRDDLQGKVKNTSYGGTDQVLNMLGTGKEHDDNYNGQLTDINSKIDDQMQQDKSLQPFYDLQNEQKQRYDKFRMQFPSIVDNIMAPERVAARNNIAAGVNQNKSSYNSRGLLYSGLRAGGDADVSSGVASDLATKQTDANQTVQDEANALENQTAQTGLAIGNARSGYASTDNESRQAVLDALIGQSQQSDQAIGNLAGAGAKLAGAGIGAAMGGSDSSAPSSIASSVAANSYPGSQLGLDYSKELPKGLLAQYAPQAALGTR